MWAMDLKFGYFNIGIVVLPDVNTRPKVMNPMPDTISVPELSPSDTVIYKLDVDEPDVGQILSFTLDVAPAIGSDMFEIDPNSTNHSIYDSS